MRKKLYTSCALVLIFFSFVFADCFTDAGNYYGVNPDLLRAIAVVESGLNPNALRKNKNGSYDIGLMQINSWWLKVLKNYGYKPEHLYNPCISIYLGAWILRQCINQNGYSYRAIDCYNKGKRAREYSSYVKKVLKVYKKIRKN